MLRKLVNSMELVIKIKKSTLENAIESSRIFWKTGDKVDLDCKVRFCKLLEEQAFSIFDQIEFMELLAIFTIPNHNFNNNKIIEILKAFGIEVI